MKPIEFSMNKLFAIILSFGLIIAPVNYAKAEEMSWGGVTNMITGITTGIIGSTILLKCKTGAATASLWAYMAGSLAYILSEMLGANAHQAHIKAQAADLEEAKKKLQEGDSLQRFALQQQLDGEKNKLAFVQKRKGWMYAVGAFHLLATIFAILEQTAVISSFGTYQGLGGCTPYDAKVTWLNGIMRVALVAAFMGGSISSSGANNGWITGGSAIVGGLMLITPVLKFMETIIGPLLETPTGRIFTFGGFTLLTTATIVDLEITQGKVETNINDITNVLITQYPTAPPSGITTGPGAEAVENNISGVSNNNSLKKLDGFYAISSSPCASNSGGGFSVNSSNCKKPMKITRPNLSGAFANNTLQSATAIGTDYVNALAAGDMARAEVLGGQLSNMAGRLQKVRDEALKKYNQVAKEKKKKLIDFDKEVKAFNESMSGKLSKSLASQGIDPQKFNKASSTSVNKPVASISAQPTTEVAAPEVPVEDVASTPETPVEEVAQTPAPTLEESLENFESNESDISPQKQVSIFKQVSNRYILNYNRFFKEEEPIAVPAPSPESAPKKTEAPDTPQPVPQAVK